MSERGLEIDRVLLPLAVAIAFFSVWQAGVVVTHTKIFPSPMDVLRGLGQLAGRSLLWRYMADSLLRVGSGYLLAILAGVPLGILLGSSDPFALAVNPVIQILRPISPLAWMPLAIIWFGVSNAAPIFLIFLASFFPIVVATMNGVRGIPPVFLQVARNFGLSRLEVMRRVVFPAILPRILTGLRIAFGIAWLVLVAAEMIAVDSGLGYLIIDARNAGKRYDLVVGGMLLIGIIGLLLDRLIRSAETIESVQWGSAR